MHDTDSRHAALAAFAAAQGADPASLAPASADASFRSYWRVRRGGETFIIMDSPPDKEPVQPWLDIAALLSAAGLHVPAVHAADTARGLLLLEDLGSLPYLAELDSACADSMYSDALDALFTMQQNAPAAALKPYDEAFLLQELELMPTWLLQRHLGHVIACEEWDVIELAFRRILDTVLSQPRCFVHRDFHSRNLMVTAEHSPGVIDFQGALHGPLTYDLVSLLRDCYIRWPAERVSAWAEAYRQRLVVAGLTDADPRRFRRWFDYTGLQRHIKVLGIFCRLCHRDNKPHYLADLPLVLDYVLEVSAQYVELESFTQLLRRLTAGVDLRQPRAAQAGA